MTIAKIGLMITLSTPKINRHDQQSQDLVGVLDPVRVMSLRIHVAIASAAAFATSLRIHLM